MVPMVPTVSWPSLVRNSLLVTSLCEQARVRPSLTRQYFLTHDVAIALCEERVAKESISDNLQYDLCLCFSSWTDHGISEIREVQRRCSVQVLSNPKRGVIDMHSSFSKAG